MNRDFVEMLSALCEAGVDFLVVGAHALAAHGIPRATGDLDIWVRPSAANADRVLAALKAFGSPLFDLTREDLTRADTVFQIGLAPSRIDVLTSVTGVSFDDAWPRRIQIRIGTIEVPIISREDFIANKRAVGRAQDLADIERLGS